MEFFERKIRPILTDDCYKCHSQDSVKIKGGLLLDSRDGLLKGGDTGPAIKPGDPDQSLLIKAVRYTDKDLQMPPKDKKLSPEKIAALEAWVRMGAPDPRVAAVGLGNVTSIREKAKTHWAFQPVHEPTVPAVRNKRFVQTPVDNFILAKLEAAKLQPSPEADKRTLIRRATFDLIGLPPTPEEVAAFIADKSPDAFAKLVDRLLASPRYGERWGRHWLDVARYADTKGYVFEEDRHFPYSYTYRDYVIRAFNEDLPYNEFIKEQIAADLMTNNPDKRSLAALGYLTLGRRFVNNIHDIIDDRIDVTCRGMMGLTVNCARCHDHKYDPIPTRDYYSLYGVFASSMEPEQEPLLGMDPPAKAREEYLAERKKREDERDQFPCRKRKRDGGAIAPPSRRISARRLRSAGVDRTNRPDGRRGAQTQTRPGSVASLDASLERWQKTPMRYSRHGSHSPLCRKKISHRMRRNWPPGFPPIRTPIHLLNPLVAQNLSYGAPPATMKEVSERYGKLFAEADKRWQDHAGRDQFTRARRLARRAAREKHCGRFFTRPTRRPTCRVAEFDRLYDVPTSQKLRALQRHVDELDATSPGAPPRAMALEDIPDPHNVHVFLRGSSDNQGAEAPREFPEILAGPNRKPFQDRQRTAGTRRGHRQQGQSADRARLRQPRLAASFRRGAGVHSERFRITLRPADASGIARLPRGAFHGRWLVHQEAAPAHHAFRGLSSKQRRQCALRQD